METTNSSQSRLVYNPQLQSAEMTKKLFVVRQEQFTLLLNNILKEKKNSIPQHYLIIGQRGMGKTTILKRMEVELHEEHYRQQFIPLLFREEQRGVQDLAEFWLNSLDALANSLEYEQYPIEMVANIDKTTQELSRKAPEIIADEAYKFLMNICRELHRRPILLIDNIDKVFSRLDISSENKKEQWVLRKLLSENGAPIIISGGVTTTDYVAIYEMPFYDFFKIQYLKKLNYDEFIKLLNNLANVTNSDASVFETIRQNTSRQKALLELTGGNPRVTVMLFDQISKGFSTNINDDLNILADALTPFYEAKLDKLSEQQQIIIDAIALNWDAISLRKLAIATRMKNNQLSPQLKRLIDDGWLETTPAYEDKGNAYFISERFFNIYYLIRNSSRKHKDKIYCLSKFLECFYGKEELERISDILLKQDICSSEQMRLHLAVSMIKALKFNKRKKIQEKTFETFLNNDKLRNEFDFLEKSLLKNFQTLDMDKITDLTTTIKSEDTAFWKNVGFSLWQKKQYEKAIICYDKLVAINPNNEYPWIWKGNCLVDLKKYKEALESFNKAIQLNSKAEYAWVWKGCCLLDMEQYDDTIENFNKAIQLNPKNEPAWFLKAVCLFELKQYEEAIKSFDKATELDPNYAVAWNNKGFTYLAIKSYDKAAFAYEKSMEINSLDLIPKFHLMFLYRDKLGKMQEATELFNSIDEQEVNQNEDKNFACRYYLHKTEFELYNQNRGLAKESLLQIFEILEEEDKISSMTNEYWWVRFGYVVIKLGCGFWLLDILKEKDYDVVLSPYYTAIQAFEIEKQDNKNGKENAEIYLNNRAVEISEPAKAIVEKIRKYMN